ncbi:MAG: metal ABC transporter substrate-binding protein [Oscillospiraceae bacterium]|nr:metal ABC transporter substrate-binding protein [Oscillospiraceae bacterium]MDD4414417.1 metal ABC transporter substrate-binding protein [Oscillospiraceae bacterium]
MNGAKIIGIVMAFIVISALLITIVLFKGNDQDNERINIVASFYPVYTAALRVADGVEGVKVINLTPAQTGCLHDYQLTPDNMISLNKADILIINGAGAESFLGNINENHPDLNILDTSKGIELIKGGNSHRHEEEQEESEEYNQHIWTSPTNYIKQIENIRDGLIGIDPDYADEYKANAEKYIGQIKEIRSELLKAADNLFTKYCIIFHGSLEYIAKDLGLVPLVSLSSGEGAGISAADLANATRVADDAGKILLIYDNQYDAEYNSVANGAELSKILKIDTAVTGDNNDSDAWIDAMKRNLNEIKKAAA